MIPRPDIAQWQEHAPWKSFFQVEQDLLISRTLVALFSDDFLKENIAFRGGTALHKLYLNPAPRYSEDIDLVQIKPGPIKPILKRIGEVITFFEEYFFLGFLQFFRNQLPGLIDPHFFFKNYGNHRKSETGNGS